jgi:hypothetical protein
MINAYELRHILQTPHPLSFWVAVVIADILSAIPSVTSSPLAVPTKFDKKPLILSEKHIRRDAAYEE